MKQKVSITKMKTRKLVAVIAAAFVIMGLGLSLYATVNAAVKGGIAPPSDEIDGAVRGGTYNTSVRVINSGDEIGTFNLSVEGECTDWVTLYDAENLTRGQITNISVANVWYAPVLVEYEIPEDVANGNYMTTVVVESTLTGETGGGVAAALGRWLYNVRIGVVGAQNLTGTTGNITVTATEVGKLLEAMVEFTNEGNVTAKPVINVTIMKDGTLVDSIEEAETGIKPGCNGSISVLYNTTGMEPGDYLANVTVSLIDATIVAVGNVTVGNVTLATEELPFTLSVAAAGDE